MKKLNIKSENCILRKNSYGVGINDVGLEELIRKNLPELEDHKGYPVRMGLSIEFLGDEKLEITPTGYELPKEVEENE